MLVKKPQYLPTQEHACETIFWRGLQTYCEASHDHEERSASCWPFTGQFLGIQAGFPSVGKVIDMDVLSNDVLLTIFDKFGRERAREVMCTVPLVCKRWRDALYGAKGHPVYRYIVVDYEKEFWTAKQRRRQLRGSQLRASESAVATWIHNNIDRGNIKYPCELEATATNLYAPNAEGLASLLRILGDELQSLQIHGRTGLLQGFKFSFLWIVPNLQRLHLDAVQDTIDQEDFTKGIAYLRQLEYLHISGEEESQRMTGLTAFPTAICSLQHLTALTFAHQNLGLLPGEISQLAKLKHLTIKGGCLDHNEGVHLPSALGHLTALQSLCLKPDETVHHETAGVPPETCQWIHMTQLTRLDLTGDYGGCDHHDGSLPSEVTSLIGLNELGVVRFNELESQTQLTSLSKLKAISIRHCSLKRMPVWMGALSKLAKLQLYGVEMYVWLFHELKSLQELEVRRCTAKQVTDSIGQLTGLTSLTFSECVLTGLSSGISSLTNLRHLALEGSYFPEFPRSLYALRAPHLRSLHLEAHQDWQDTLDVRRAVNQGRAYSSMPVAARDLAWLLRHDRLMDVTITATKAEFAELKERRKALAIVCRHDVLTIELCD